MLGYCTFFTEFSTNRFVFRNNTFPSMRSHKIIKNYNVSPKAYISPSAQIMDGCIIEQFAGVNFNVSVDTCSIIKTGALTKHYSVVTEGCCESYSTTKSRYLC